MATSLEHSTWYYAQDRRKLGPVSWLKLQQLALAGQLRPGDMVLADGTPRWLQAGSVAGLFPSSANTATDRFRSWPGESSGPSLASSATVGRDMAGDSAAASGLPNIPGYTIRGELGRGGMGVVYRAEQVKLKRQVALKMVLGGAIAGTVQLERFRAEAEAVARLQHPNIVQIYEVGEHDGLPFFSLEYCAGGSLSQHLNGTPLPSREAAGLVETLARAMHAAHERNLVHRDLKPANVLLTADGVPKITDFGLVKKLDEAGSLTQSGAVMGTPCYMAPEQARGETREQGPAVNIYALGAILYELLTGRPPFKAANPMETLVQVAHDEPVPPSRLQSKVPADLETICLKCLEKSPARRYRTARDLADELGRFRGGETIQARPAGRTERCWKWARRRPAAAALLAVSGLALLLMLAGGLYFNVQLRQERNAALDQKSRAERNEALARQQEQETQRQKVKVEAERKRAEEGEADAKKQLDQARRSLLTAQVWRAAGVWARDPLQGLFLLQDENACPKDLRDFAWGYFHAQCLQWQPAGLKHRYRVRVVAVSPDNKTLAVGTYGGTITLWDLATRREAATWTGHKGAIESMAYSPDGTLLATGGVDRTVKLWDVATRKEVATLAGHSGQVNGVAFSPDGNWLAAGSGRLDPKYGNADTRYRDGEVWLWNVAERKKERLLLPREGDSAVTCLAFAPDGRHVAAGTTYASDVRIIDVATGRTVHKLRGGDGWVQNLAYSADGRTLAWSTSQQLVHLGDMGSGSPRRTLRGHQHIVWGLAWAPDGKTLATGDTGGWIKLWNPANGKERLSLRTHDRAWAINMTFDREGRTLFVGHTSQWVTLWQIKPRPAWATHEDGGFPANGFRAVAVGPDNRTLAGATQRKTVQLWDLGSSDRASRTLALDAGLATSLAFARGGKLLAISVQACGGHHNQDLLPRGECQLWDVETGKRLATLKGSGRPVRSVVFTPDGTLLLAGDEDGKVWLWDAADRRKLAVLTGPGGSVRALAVSPDGQILAAAGGNQIKLWDLAERKERTNLEGHRAPSKVPGPQPIPDDSSRSQTLEGHREGAKITGLAFVDGGKALASAGTDGMTRLWNVDTGTLRSSLPAQAASIFALAATRDGLTLALGCQDRLVRVFDVRTGQLRAVLPSHTREVVGVAFSDDRGFLVSASTAQSEWYVAGGEIKVWKADR